MKIKRIVNGQEVEFELTDMEMTEASEEQEKYYRIEDLETVLQEAFDDDIKLSKEEFDKAITLFRKYRMNDDQWRYDAESAINAVLNERGDK